MTNFTKNLAQQLAGRVKTTHQLEKLAPLGNDVTRVVASFNRQPKAEEVAAMIDTEFKGRACAIPGSFRVRRDGFRVVVAGYASLKAMERPLADAETAGFREIAKNVFMDPEDQAVWAVEGDRIVRAATENLAEIASTITVKPSIRIEPTEALASVSTFAGPKNTQIVSYIDPVTASVVTGVRVSDDQVWSEAAGLTEIAQDQVVDVESLNGKDYVESVAVAKLGTKEFAGVDTNAMLDYYRELYKYDPAFFTMIEEIIMQRAVA